MKNPLKKLAVILSIFLILSCKKEDSTPSKYGTVTDIEGNVYKTVIIDNKTFMAENLKTSKLNDGTNIPNVIDNSSWDILTTPGLCWYNNDITNKTTYGALYNWYTVGTWKVCPVGWHVPSDSEWTDLATFLGGEDMAGYKLKEEGIIHWKKYYWNDGSLLNATNESGFTGLPGGARFTGPTSFINFGEFGYFWSSTEGRKSLVNPTENLAHYRLLLYWRHYFSDHEDSKSFGLSVRCMKD